jgi:hypothetical protein
MLPGLILVKKYDRHPENELGGRLRLCLVTLYWLSDIAI